MVPEAAGQHFQARGHSFSLYGPTLSRQITYLFISCYKLAYKRVWMGCGKCQLSVKILSICQLSVKFWAICQLSVKCQLIIN